MQSLSSVDGSAEAVRDAAESALAQNENRLALERELDRLNTAVQGSAAALGQHLSWTLVAQAFLLFAYLTALIGAWSLPLPGKRWLLLGIAGFAIAATLTTYLGLRAARDRVGPLKQQRQRIEDALERVAARPPAFARQGAITALLAQASTRGLPLLICGGWVALGLYTLALPLPNDLRATVSLESRDSREARGNSATTPSVRSTRSGAASSKAGPPASSPAPPEPAPPESANADASGSPLLDFLRRAVNAPPAADTQEGVKP